MPDLICAHPGWGEPFFLKAIWPDVSLLCYQEFFYKSMVLILILILNFRRTWLADPGKT
jgi:hypothetical protein